MKLPRLMVGVISAGFPNFRYDIAEEYRLETIRLLTEMKGVKLIAARGVQIEEDAFQKALKQIMAKKPDILVLELGTYTYGSVLMKCLEQLGDSRLLLWAFREPILTDYPGLPLNSLCALNMFTSFLHRIGKEDYLWLYGQPSEAEIQEQLRTIMLAARIKKGLQEARFASIGGAVPGFYLSAVDELKFRQEVGPEIIHWSLASLLADMESLDDKAVQAEMAAVNKKLPGCTAGNQALEKTARMTLAVKRFGQLHKITGFGMKCWPELQELYQLAPCGVLALLNQEGILVSCEGDMTGLATMYMQSSVSHERVFLTDLVNITPEGIVKLWHCGAAPPGLALAGSTPSFGEHPTIKGGIGIGGSFPLKKGRILLAKLSEGNPYRLLLAKGECIEPDRQLTGNQGDVRLTGDSSALLELITGRGIEHHYCLAYEADEKVLEMLCRMSGFEILKGKEEGYD